MTSNRQNDLNSGHETRRVGKSKGIAYLLLLGLSTLSALVIWYPGHVLYTYLIRSGSLVGIIYIIPLVTIGQYISIIPATLAVLFVYSKLSRQKQLHRINRLVWVGLPLLFNILAGVSYFIVNSTPIWLSNISASLLAHNLTLTIKEENIMPSTTGYGDRIYHAVLHAENNSGQEISTVFLLGDYSTKTPREDNWNHMLGGESPVSHIPPGESDMIVDIPIYDDMVCRSDITKPLYLLYLLPGSSSYDGRLAVDDFINYRLLTIDCSTWR
jgi:hypothetical protein